ncbi:uncharacterized protein [Ptychodera flava]|uniref:uncharacterized protein n=1 Tax=Ptychodera flava TaxID=63121 RepID=UPI00396A97B1
MGRNITTVFTCGALSLKSSTALGLGDKSSMCHRKFFASSLQHFYFCTYLALVSGGEIYFQVANSSTQYQAGDLMKFDFGIAFSNPHPQCGLNISLGGRYIDVPSGSLVYSEDFYEWEIKSCANIYDKYNYTEEWQSDIQSNKLYIRISRISEPCESNMTGFAILRISEDAMIGRTFNGQFNAEYTYDCDSATPLLFKDSLNISMETAPPILEFFGENYEVNETMSAILGDIVRFRLYMSYPRGVAFPFIRFIADDFHGDGPTLLNVKWVNALSGDNVICVKNYTASGPEFEKCSKNAKHLYLKSNDTQDNKGLRLNNAAEIFFSEVRIMNGSVYSDNNRLVCNLKTRLILNPNFNGTVKDVPNSKHKLSVIVDYGSGKWTSSVGVIMNNTRNRTDPRWAKLRIARADILKIKTGEYVRLRLIVDHVDTSNTDALNVSFSLITTSAFPFQKIVRWTGPFSNITVQDISRTSFNILVGTLNLDYKCEIYLNLVDDIKLKSGESYGYVGAVQIAYSDHNGSNKTYSDVKTMTFDYEMKLPCATDWLYRQGFCYLFGEDMVNQSTAAATCRKYGAHLVSIHSEKENLFIYDNLRDLYIPSWFAWIGLANVQTHGEAFWVDKSSFDFNKMADPDIPQHITCGAYSVNAFADITPTVTPVIQATWYDNDCSKLGGYVCKYKTIVCPAGWTPHLQTCYYVSDVDGLVLNFTDSMTFCHESDGHLVSINTEEEHHMLAALLAIGESYWIGLCNRRGLNLQWTDGSFFSSKSSWLPPITLSEEGPHCVQISTTGSVLTPSNGTDCSEKISFICERGQNDLAIGPSWRRNAGNDCQCIDDTTESDCPCCDDDVCQCISPSHQEACLKSIQDSKCLHSNNSHIVDVINGDRVICGPILSSTQDAKHQCFYQNWTPTSVLWADIGTDVADVITLGDEPNSALFVSDDGKSYLETDLVNFNYYSVSLSRWFCNGSPDKVFEKSSDLVQVNATISC